MKQYYKIGEISKLYQIGPDSLRYYEKLGLLTPKRGENDYRLYGLNDLWRLNVIRDLRRLDFSMEKIEQYMSDRSVSSTRNLFLEELQIIEEHIQILNELRENVEERLSTLDESQNQPLGEIRVKTFPVRHCHKNLKPFRNDEEMDMLTKQLTLMDQIDPYIIGNNRIGSFLSLENALNRNYLDYSGVFIIDKNGPDQLEAGDYLSVSFSGDSHQYETYFPEIQKYADSHDLILSGPILELLWVDIHQASDPEEHITEIQIKCGRKF